jgi:hypothetical protein
MNDMSVQALFGIGVLLNFIAFGVVTKLYIWPRVRGVRGPAALMPLVVPHAFRFVGLSFLVPGVVSPTLPPAFAAPVAYGDLVAAILALVSIWALAARASWAIPMVWLFNVWGTADLLNAIYEGQIGTRIDLGSLGAAYFIPTILVPPLLILHGLIFRLLLRKK